MNYPKVKSIDHHGKDTASITLENNHTSIVVFCHLCEIEIGDEIKEYLEVLDVNYESAYLDDWPQELKDEKSKMWIKKIGPYSYKGCGKAIDHKKGIIEVLGFKINFDDEIYSDWIEFKINRLDLW